MKETEHDDLAAAERIGRILVRDAIWDGDACTWLSQRESNDVAVSPAAVRALDHSVPMGVSGVGLFLSRLSRVTDDPLIAEVACGVARLLTREVTRIPQQSPLDTDRVVALLEITRTLQMRGAERLALEVSRQVQVDPDRTQVNVTSDPPLTWNRSPMEATRKRIQAWLVDAQRFPCFADPLFGDRLVAHARASGEPTWREAARLFANHVRMQSEACGQPWLGSPECEYPALGLRRGLAGIGHFFLTLADSRIPTLSE